MCLIECAKCSDQTFTRREKGCKGQTMQCSQQHEKSTPVSSPGRGEKEALPLLLVSSASFSNVIEGIVKQHLHFLHAKQTGNPVSQEQTSNTHPCPPPLCCSSRMSRNGRSCCKGEARGTLQHRRACFNVTLTRCGGFSVTGTRECCECMHGSSHM